MNTLAKWTIDDYHQMIATGILDDRPVELLNGEIVQMAPEGPPHRFYGESMADHLRSRLTGRAWIQEAHPITLVNSEPDPDLAVVRLPREQYRETIAPLAFPDVAVLVEQLLA